MKKVKKAKSLRKYGVWLHNHTDSRDDEWIYIRATSKKDALKKAEDQYDDSRFSLGDAELSVKFRREHGLSRYM
jgi:folate-binding Fe-S cluster repair protein YgfZ